MEVYYKGHFVERMARVHGEGEVNVNYRHVIGSLMRNVGAFARYRFREQLLPTMHFRITYDALREWRGERADVEYVRVLHLAAQTMEATVDSALSLLLETGQPFDYAEVRDLDDPQVPEAPALVLSVKPDLKIYDGLLTGRLDGSGCADEGHGHQHDPRAHRTAVPPISAGGEPAMGAQSVARFTEAGYGDALSASPEVLKQERPVEDIKGWRSRSATERSSFHMGEQADPRSRPMKPRMLHLGARLSSVAQG